VLRPNLDFRGYAGQIASGVFRPGDEVMALPARRRSRITRIVTYDGDLDSAVAPQSVTLCLADEIDISRGDAIVPVNSLPHVSRRFRAHIVWMNAKALEPGRSYFIKHTSHLVRGVVRAINFRIDVNSLERVGASRLELNEIGEISLDTHHPLYFDSYAKNRVTGAFIVIDPLSNETLGAAMIIDIEGREETRGQVTDADRAARYGHKGAVVTVEDTASALQLERELFDRGANVVVTTSLEPSGRALAAAAGLIVIFIARTAENAVPTQEAIRRLERAGILKGMEEQLIEGEGI
jgi:selenocysteine-specific translation elongation factor